MIDEVSELLRDAAARVVLPWFKRLADCDIQEKAPGELVTVADQRAEEIITAGLRRLVPESVVIGEEAVAEEPSLLDRLRDTGTVWLVDPIDGTGNYAAGRRPFVMMVALLRAGVPQASWIFDPVVDSLAVAQRDGGSYLDGRRISSSAGTPTVAGLRGSLSARYLPDRLRVVVEAGGDQVGAVLPGLHCAGQEHQDIATGVQDFAIFWRTLPWDHVPGTLLVCEAGGVARRFDGSPYDHADNRCGLLVARSEAAWRQLHATLLSGG